MSASGMDSMKGSPLRIFADRAWIVPALFALALGLRLLLILLAPQQPFSDGAFYVARAAELASGMGYQEAGHPTAFWPVGYPALLAASMMLLGKSLLGPMLLNLLSAALILHLILWFGRTVGGGELAARCGALLYALYPAHIAYTGAALSETASTAVAMAAFALLIARRTDWRGLIGAGLLFGLAALMRTQMLLFPIGAVVALFLVYRAFGWKDAVRAMLIVHLAMAAIVLPWSLRNQHALGAFVPVSTNGGVALYTGANDQATGGWFAWEHGPLWAASGIPFENRIERQVALDRRFKALAAQWIADHPARFAALGFKKAALLWVKDSDGFWGLQHSYPAAEPRLRIVQWLNQLYYCVLLGLALVCFSAASSALFRHDERLRPLALLVCMPAFVTLTAFVFTGQIRYHYPAMPFVALAAGWTAAMLAQRRAAPRNIASARLLSLVARTR